MAKMPKPGSREEAKYEREWWEKERKKGKFRSAEDLGEEYGMSSIVMDYLTGKGMTPEEARNFYNPLSALEKNAEPGEKTRGQILDDAVAYRGAKNEAARAARAKELTDDEAHKGELRRMTRGEGPPEDPNVTVERYRYMGKQLEAGKGGGPSSSGGGGKGKQEQAGAALPVSLSDLIAAEALGPKKPSGGYIESGGKKTYVPKRAEAEEGRKPMKEEDWEKALSRWKATTRALPKASKERAAEIAGDEKESPERRGAAQLEMRARRSKEEYKAANVKKPEVVAKKRYEKITEEQRDLAGKYRRMKNPRGAQHLYDAENRDLLSRQAAGQIDEAAHTALAAANKELYDKRLKDIAEEEEQFQREEAKKRPTWLDLGTILALAQQGRRQRKR